MPLSTVVRSLRKERLRLQAGLGAIETAISTLIGLDHSGRGGRRKMSAAARRRISAAQKKRWAKWKSKRR